MQYLLDWYADSRNYPIVALLSHIVLVIIYFILARIAIRISLSFINRLMQSKTVRMDQRRRNTLTSLLDNVARYMIYFIFVVEALTSINIHVETLLAGAGIAGLAIGFGAQSLIKDVLTGLFILFEDQYGVGDLVKINQFTGTVQSIGLRLTRIKAWTGEVEIIPNGQIQQVTNYSRNNSIAVIDIAVSYEVELKHAMRVIQIAMDRVKAENHDIVGDVQIQGVQSLEQNHVVVRVTAECRPTTQNGVERLAYQRIKEAFDQEGIAIPGATRMVWVQAPADKARAQTSES